MLFVCKLNQVTQSEDLEIIFSRFGKVVSCEANGNDLAENVNDGGGLKKNSFFCDLFLRRAFEHCRVLAL